jgi:hypothetical protein
MKKLKSRLNSRNDRYHSVHFTSNNTKMKPYIAIILHVVPYGFGTWSLDLREGQRLRVFENRALTKLSGPKWEVGTGR